MKAQKKGMYMEQRYETPTELGHADMLHNKQAHTHALWLTHRTI